MASPPLLCSLTFRLLLRVHFPLGIFDTLVLLVQHDGTSKNALSILPRRATHSVESRPLSKAVGKISPLAILHPSAFANTKAEPVG